MTLTTHGIREGSKADLPGEEKVKAKAEKEKEKAEENEDSSDREGKEKGKEREEKEEPTWWVKKTMKMNGKRQKIGMRQMTAIGPMTRHGKKAIGPMKIYTGKKGKKGKDDEGKGKPGDGKGKSNYVQPQTSSNSPAIQQQAHYSTAAPSTSAHGFLVTGGTEPARVEIFSAEYEQEEEEGEFKK
eukprot:s570_g12.t1